MDLHLMIHNNGINLDLNRGQLLLPPSNKRKLHPPPANILNKYPLGTRNPIANLPAPIQLHKDLQVDLTGLNLKNIASLLRQRDIGEKETKGSFLVEEYWFDVAEFYLVVWLG